MYNVLCTKQGKPIKIALVGGARTGKDTIAIYLGSTLGFIRIAFGDSLKDMLFKVFPDLPVEPKPRGVMINFGQSCRAIDPMVWIKHLDRKAKHLEDKNVIITDVRQPNEIEYCKDNGYILIKVVAPTKAQEQRALEGGEILDVNNELDQVALGFDGFDYEIINDGSLLELYNKVNEVIKDILLKE